MGFVKDVLPRTGILYVITRPRIGKSTRHHECSSYLDVEVTGRKYARTNDVYFALASFDEPYRDDDGKIRRRTKRQAKFLSSFFLDVDCGLNKKNAYKDKRTALRALLALCKGLALPRPYVVDSGNGLHVYWPLRHEVTAPEWAEVATLFKAIRQHVKFISDPARDCDVCSILRLPGTFNHKRGVSVPVKLLCEAAPAKDFSWWREHLQRLASKLGVEVLQAPARPSRRSDDLTAGLYEDTPCDAGKVAEACAQVRLMRDRRGDVSEPHWRLVLGLLRHCERGYEVAHEWSRGASSYDPDALRDRWERWEGGPPTCATFARDGDGSCDGCAHAGQITTPLQMGRRPPPQAEQPKPKVVKAPTKKKALELPEFAKGYEYKQGYMIRWVRDAQGELKAKKFCRDELHVVRRFHDSDGAKCRVVALASGPDNKKFVKSADLPVSLVAAGGADFKKALGENEIMASPDRGAWDHLSAFIQDELHRLQQKQKAIKLYDTYGWHEAGFVWGGNIYLRDGDVSPVHLGGGAKERQAQLKVRTGGSLARWSDAVNWLYAREGMEALQYVVCCAFGSVLGPFQPSIYHGIPVALVGTESGRGKTSACTVATSVWGDPDAMFLNSTMGATVNARNALMGTLRNIPVLIDEITNIRIDELSKLLYAISNGADRLRLERKRGSSGAYTIAERFRWNLVTFLTSNSPLIDLLLSGSSNMTPEAMRVVEINLDKSPVPHLNVTEVEKHVDGAVMSGGFPGHEFIRYVVTHEDKIHNTLNGVNASLLKMLPQLGHGEHRFWRFQAGCAVTAALLTKKLGILDFDTVALSRWLISHLKYMVCDVEQTNIVDYHSVLDSLLLSLAGQALTTYTYPTRRGEASMIDDTMPRPTKPLVARVVLDDQHGGSVYISERYIRQWCSEHRIDRHALLGWLSSTGMCVKHGRFNIGKGTSYKSGSSACIQIKLAALDMTVANIKEVISVGGDDHEEARAG